AEGRRDAEQSAPGTRSWIGYGRRRPDVPGSSTRHWKAGCWRGISIQAGGRKATVRRGSVSESAPACDPLDADGDDRQPLELHGGELAVARLQQRLSPAVLVASRQDLRPPAQHHPGEPPPILVIVVEDDGRLRVFEDVAQPLQRPVTCALGLAVDGDIERVVHQPEANRNDVRRRARIGGRQMADPSRVDEPTLARREHASLPTSRRPAGWHKTSAPALAPPRR